MTKHRYRYMHSCIYIYTSRYTLYIETCRTVSLMSPLLSLHISPPHHPDRSSPNSATAYVLHNRQVISTARGSGDNQFIPMLHSSWRKGFFSSNNGVSLLLLVVLNILFPKRVRFYFIRSGYSSL